MLLWSHVTNYSVRADKLEETVWTLNKGLESRLAWTVLVTPVPIPHYRYSVHPVWISSNAHV